MEETEKEITEQTQEQETIKQEEHAYNNYEKNIQKLREAKEDADRKIAALSREIESLKQPIQSDDDDDDIVARRDLKAVNTKIETMSQQLAEAQKAATISQLNVEYSDYKKVMTQKNIDSFIEQFPELADTLYANKNQYTQLKSAYKMIKQFGIYQDDPHSKTKEKIKENMNKPLPASATGSSATVNPLEYGNLFAEGLTDEVKRKLRELNDKARRGY